VQWAGHWNRNIHDLQRLTGFIDDKLGKKVTWQTTSLSLPVKELRVSPILFITGQVGVKLGEVRYRKILAEELKRAGAANWRGTSHPPIEAVTIDGRTVILYSKYDFCCALEGDRPYACRGYVDADGRKIAMNLFLYAITY
jgi:hypothetical protein